MIYANDDARQRREILKSLIRQLHDGVATEQVQQAFAKHFSQVSASEISQIEQELVADGLPISEIQRLCDVHAAVFKGSIEQIHQSPADIPGHPVQIFHLENKRLEALMDGQLERARQAMEAGQPPRAVELAEALDKLWEVDKHYSRKENLLFPYLERYGVTAPPKVMWAVDDEIRTHIKLLRQAVADGHTGEAADPALAPKLKEAMEQIREMIFKEENILFPLAYEKLHPADWASMAAESDEIGFTLLEKSDLVAWPHETGQGQEATSAPQEQAPADRIQLPSGSLRQDELAHLLNALPFDITYVDASDTVRYFSQGKERLFARTKAIIGRQVSLCHPPDSVSAVETILDDFKAGKRDQADFWLHLQDAYALIRYFAVRDEHGTYLGTVEVTQNIAPLQKISGEKRLLDDQT